MIKILLNLGSSYFTLLGQISQSILNISCSILIVVVLVFVIFFETEGPEYYIKAMLIGVILLSINQIINLIIFGWKLEQLWGISLILISIISVFLIQKEKLLFGVLPILVMIIFNNYILPFGLGGFGVGSELLKFTSILLLIKWIGNR